MEDQVLLIGAVEVSLTAGLTAILARLLPRHRIYLPVVLASCAVLALIVAIPLVLMMRPDRRW